MCCCSAETDGPNPGLNRTATARQKDKPNPEATRVSLGKIGFSWNVPLSEVHPGRPPPKLFFDTQAPPQDRAQVGAALALSGVVVNSATHSAIPQYVFGDYN